MMMMIPMSEFGSTRLPHGGERLSPPLGKLRKAVPLVCLVVFLAVQIMHTKSILWFFKANLNSSSPNFSNESSSSSSAAAGAESSLKSKSNSQDDVITNSSMDSMDHYVEGGEKSLIIPRIQPDWHMTVDCSAYSRDCVVKQLQRRQRYADYPLQFTEDTKHKHPYKWQTRLPDGWQQSLQENAIVLDQDKQAKNQTLAKIKDPNILKCVQEAQAKSVNEQLDELLEHRLHGRMNNTKHHMVAFTISDYSYAKTQMHDIFAMAHDTVEMKDAFFMVTMDTPTAELACQAGYPFLMWPQSTDDNEEHGAGGALKSVVANTKLEISNQLLLRDVSLFFFEMDIWFIQSPKRFLDEQSVDMLFATHLNNPNAINIGVYSAISNNATKEYFQHCIDILQQSPTTHDQLVMQSMLWLIEDYKKGRILAFQDLHYKDPKPQIPIIHNPITAQNFVAFQIMSDVRLLPTTETLAIHPLCWKPLVSPHGKQMMAKEMGAWYGSKGYYRQTAEDDNQRKQRYLWLDGGYPWNAWSPVMTWNSYHPHYDYHSRDSMQWNIAISIALARRTNRIWVLPKILDDRGVQFLWTILDLEPVENELNVQVRETNFPTDPRSWKSPDVPFDPVARSAMDGKQKLFVQLDASAINQQNGSWTGDILSWDFPKLGEGRNGTSPWDAYFALHSIIPELDNAELLLSGLPAGRTVINPLQTKYKSKYRTSVEHNGKIKLSMAEKEIFEVYKKLRWCTPADKDRMNPGDEHNTAGRTVAPWDCYGKGKDETGVQ